MSLDEYYAQTCAAGPDASTTFYEQCPARDWPTAMRAACIVHGYGSDNAGDEQCGACDLVSWSFYLHGPSQGTVDWYDHESGALVAIMQPLGGKAFNAPTGWACVAGPPTFEIDGLIASTAPRLVWGLCPSHDGRAGLRRGFGVREKSRRKRLRAGVSPTSPPLTSEVPMTGSLAADQASAYVFATTTAAQIMSIQRVPLDGGAPEDLGAQTIEPSNIAIDDDAIYFGSRGVDAGIFRLAKPR